jgi:hypothetical protein
VRRQLEQVLDRRFAITHTTLQVEHVSTPERGRLLDVRPRPGTHPERGRA